MKQMVLERINKIFPNNPVKRLMIIITIFVSIVLLLAGIVLRVVLEPTLRRQSNEIAEIQFFQAESSMRELKLSAKNIATQILLDDNCRPITTATNEDALDTFAIAKCYRQLNLLKSTNPYVDSIFIVNRNVDSVMTSEYPRLYRDINTFYNQNLIEYALKKEHGFTFSKTSVEQNSYFGFVLEEDAYTYIAPRLVKGDEIKSSVIVNMSLDYYTEKIIDVYNEPDSCFIVADDKEILVEKNLISGLNSDDIQAWIAYAVEKDYQYDDKDILDNNYTLVRYYSPDTNIHYAIIKPTNAIYAQLISVERTMGVVLCCLLCFVLLLVILSSNAIYKMFGDLNFEKVNIARALKEHREKINAHFWENYLLMTRKYNDEELENEISTLEIANMNSGILVLLRCIDLQVGSKDERAKLRNDYRNVFSKVFQAWSPAFLINHADCMIFLFPVENADWKNAKAVQLLKERIPGAFYIISSEMPIGIKEYPYEYERLLEATSLTFFYPENSFLDYNEMKASHNVVLNRSTRRFVQNLDKIVKDAQWKKLWVLIAEFEEGLLDMTYECYLNHIVWLVMSLRNIFMPFLSKQLRDECKFDNLNTLIQPLQKACCRKEILELIQAYFEDLILAFEIERKKKEPKCNVAAINQYIIENYSDDQLSLNTIAVHFGISPDYLRKIYKDSSGIFLADYILQVRIKAATEKIIETKQPIKDIAVECGFSNANYFYTCFRKTHGITPINYRLRYADEKGCSE